MMHNVQSNRTSRNRSYIGIWSHFYSAMVNAAVLGSISSLSWRFPCPVGQFGLLMLDRIQNFARPESCIPFFPRVEVISYESRMPATSAPHTKPTSLYSARNSDSELSYSLYRANTNWVVLVEIDKKTFSRMMYEYSCCVHRLQKNSDSMLLPTKFEHIVQWRVHI